MITETPWAEGADIIKDVERAKEVIRQGGQISKADREAITEASEKLQIAFKKFITTLGQGMVRPYQKDYVEALEAGILKSKTPYKIKQAIRWAKKYSHKRGAV